MVSAVLTLGESKVPDLALRRSSERRLVNLVGISFIGLKLEHLYQSFKRNL